MRYLTLLFVLAGLLTVCTSCPREEGTGDQQAVALPNGDGDKPATDMPLTPPDAAAPIVCKYQIDSVTLGTALDALQPRWPDDGTVLVNRNWIEEGKTGVIDIAPADGKQLPGESATFVDGQLITFMRAVEMDEAAYTKEVEDLTTKYGAPSATVPEWAKDTDFFKNMAFGEGNIIVSIWGDEPNRVAFCAIYDKDMKATIYMLVHVDHFATFVEKANQMMGMPPAGEAMPPAEGGMPPAEGAMPPAEGGVPPAEGGAPPATPEPPAAPEPPAGDK